MAVREKEMEMKMPLLWALDTSERSSVAVSDVSNYAPAGAINSHRDMVLMVPWGFALWLGEAQTETAIIKRPKLEGLVDEAKGSSSQPVSARVVWYVSIASRTRSRAPFRHVHHMRELCASAARDLPLRQENRTPS